MRCPKKIKFLCGLLFSLCFAFFCSQNVSAVSISTSSFDYYYRPQPDSSLRWVNGLLYQVPTQTYQGYRYQFNTSFTPTGNFGSLHFETNIVAYKTTPGQILEDSVFPNANLNQLQILACSSSAGGSVQLSSRSISWTKTPWWENGEPRLTLTIYGDVILNNLQSVTQNVVCAIGSNDFAFVQKQDLNYNLQIYFERNPMSITFSNNQSDALLQQQIQIQSSIDQNLIITADRVSEVNDSVQELNSSVQDVNDALTDPTVSGDFTMPDVPSFGPIATILNSVIDLPRVFLTPGSCVDLVGPMPILTDQNFVIPCPKKLLEPFWDAVVYIENFFAVYIWFRTAMFIIRSVKKLRDPQNDDEEYLDL